MRKHYRTRFVSVNYRNIFVLTAILALLSFAILAVSNDSDEDILEYEEVAVVTTTIGPITVPIVEDDIEEDILDDDPLTNCDHEQDIYSNLPNTYTNMFTCEPYQMSVFDEDGNVIERRSIFNSKSDQYKLQQECYTNDIGLRTYSYDNEQYFCVAMGNAYGREIGITYEVELENGYLFNVILGDFKHPIDGSRNWYDYGDPTTNYDDISTTNVLEFIVDMDTLDSKVKQTGTLSVHKIFGGLHGSGGNIRRITYKGKVWNNGKNPS